MKKCMGWFLTIGLGLLCPALGMADEVVFETTSAYHHIKVVDKGRVRVLHFDNATGVRKGVKL